MTSLASAAKVIRNVNKEKIDKKNKITSKRLNETFELLKIPYQASSKVLDKGQRVYELKNSKGEVAEFSSMKEMIFETPLGEVIKERGQQKINTNYGFFSDITEKEKNPRRRKGDKPAKTTKSQKKTQK